MTERFPEPADTDDAQISHLMDTLGLSRAAAEYRLGVRDGEQSRFTPAESKLLHPASSARRRFYGNRPPVGEDSEDVMTGLIDEEQAQVNVRGAALARQALRLGRAELSAHERAIERARSERRGKRS